MSWFFPFWVTSNPKAIEQMGLSQKEGPSFHYVHFEGPCLSNMKMKLFWLHCWAYWMQEKISQRMLVQCRFRSHEPLMVILVALETRSLLKGSRRHTNPSFLGRFEPCRMTLHLTVSLLSGERCGTPDLLAVHICWSKDRVKKTSFDLRIWGLIVSKTRGQVWKASLRKSKRFELQAPSNLSNYIYIYILSYCYGPFKNFQRFKQQKDPNQNRHELRSVWSWTWSPTARWAFWSAKRSVAFGGLWRPCWEEVRPSGGRGQEAEVGYGSKTLRP